MEPHCIRCGDDVEKLPKFVVCWECSGALCMKCTGVDDHVGIPTKEPKAECPTCNKAMSSPRYLKSMKMHNASVIVVSHCPYCGSNDWKTPVKKPNGKICTHPTKLPAKGTAT